MTAVIRRAGLALLGCIGLSGCAANDPTVPTDAEVCEASYGLPFGTPRFADCMASRAERRARLAAVLMSNPNFPVPLPPLPPPVYLVPRAFVYPAPVLRTTCSSSRGVTACVDR